MRLRLQKGGPLALNIKNREVEELAAEVAKMTGESKTEAIRKALAQRRQRLASARGLQDREVRLRRLFEEELWAVLPPEERGRPVSRKEHEEILGFGKEGV